MKAKLYQKYLEGYSGWDEPSAKEFIEASLFKHVERHRENGGQLVDIANLAMMLWNFEMKAAAIKPNAAAEEGTEYYGERLTDT